MPSADRKRAKKAIVPGEAAKSDDAGRTSSGISADMG